MALRVASLKGLKNLKIKIPRAAQIAAAAIYSWRTQRLAGNLRLGPEDIIHLAIMAYLRANLISGAVAYHTPSEASRGKAWWAKLIGMGFINGIPDITILSQGRAYFIEVKSDSGKLSVDQEAFLEWANASGFPAIVARDVVGVGEFLTAHNLRA